MKEKLPEKKIRIFVFLITAILSFLTSTLTAQDKPQLKIGGALRFNYNLSTWKDSQVKRLGDYGYDMFRVNIHSSWKDVYLDAEYRLYSEAFGGGFLKQGWIGYRIDNKNDLQVGLSQVPFGLQQYNSHNWFFNMTYYMGLEDDHDMGIKFVHTGERFDYHLAFYKNAEELTFGNSSETSPDRYSYDVTGRNKEINQVNVKGVYKFGKDHIHQVGGGVQYGGLYNLDTEKTGSHHGFAVHYELLKDPWNVKAQVMTVGHDPKNAAGESNDVLQMGAYGASYLVAADFNIYSLAVSRNIPVNWGPISNLEIYNDFGYMDKRMDAFEDSVMNVTGVLVTAGFVYTYFDFAAGYNHSWLGGNFVDDFAQGDPDAQWEMRFNINLGFYF